MWLREVRGLGLIATLLLCWLDPAGQMLRADESAPRSQPANLRAEAAEAMRKAVEFYRRKVAVHGGYVYRYSEDLSKREGEGKTGLDTVWVQPPGTPTVLLALVDAYERTREPYLLEAAKEAGECLRRGQLESGGWTDRIEFEEKARARFAYRVDSQHAKRPFNTTTFDDDKSQAAIRAMMRLDQVLEFREPSIHESVEYALNSVLKAQFPNGAWSQGFSEFPVASEYPVKRASYPESWSREYPGGPYWNFYTFNDNAIADTIDTLLLASRIYGDDQYRAAFLRAGDFILLAQMPEPQPAWAQQYNFEMHPVWARKFEPPAISGGESQGLIQTLLTMYLESGDRKYLKPIPRAIEYLRKSEIEPGRLARFYELQSNRPLYFTRDYQLTYDGSDTPTHYGFKVSHKLDELQRKYDELERLDSVALAKRREQRWKKKDGSPSDSQVNSLIRSLDSRGAWVTEGRLSYHGKGDDTRRIIESTVFCRNLDSLSRYLAK